MLEALGFALREMTNAQSRRSRKTLCISLPTISGQSIVLLGNVLVTILKSRRRKYSWRRVRKGLFHQLSGGSCLEVIMLILSSRQESHKSGAGDKTKRNEIGTKKLHNRTEAFLGNKDF